MAIGSTRAPPGPPGLAEAEGGDCPCTGGGRSCCKDRHMEVRCELLTGRDRKSFSVHAEPTRAHLGFRGWKWGPHLASAR